jgi:hypothetical protein
MDPYLKLFILLKIFFFYINFPYRLLKIIHNFCFFSLLLPNFILFTLIIILLYIYWFYLFFKFPNLIYLKENLNFPRLNFLPLIHFNQLILIQYFHLFLFRIKFLAFLKFIFSPFLRHPNFLS